MSQTVITAGQSLADVALQELGSVATLFDLADASDLAITDDLTPGALLAVPASANALPDIAGYFAGRAQRLNTGAGYSPVTPRPIPRDFDRNDFNNQDFDVTTN